MRFIALAFVLVLALGCVQAYPLHGVNGAVNCTLFGVTKVPIPGQDPNATVQECALKVDVGLIGTRNATFELVDSKDKAFSPELSLTRALQPGRQLLAFVVPKDSLFKLFKVSPSEGNPFAINWWNTPKKISGDITLRYYGVVDTRMNPNEQSVAYDVKITNNGTNPVYISPENFTLLDQWGWEYYTIDGFSPTNLEAKKSARVKVNFSSLSPLSKPASLVYEYLTSNPIAIDLEKDTGQLSDAQVYGTNTPSTVATPAAVQSAPIQVVQSPIKSPIQAIQSPIQTPIQTPIQSRIQSPIQAVPQISSNIGKSLADQINATKERLANMGRPGGNSSIGGQINSSVKDAMARLEKMKKGLPHGQNNTSQSTGSPTIATGQ
jgi:hypothetical protein